MSHLRDAKDLLSLLPEGLPAGLDPALALERRGHTVEPELAQLLRTSTPARRLSEETRARLRSRIPPGTRLVARLEAPAARAVTAASATPDYDLVLALRLSFANQTIAQLRAEGVLPAGLPLEQTAQLFSADILERFQIAPPRTHAPLPFPAPHVPPVPGVPIAGTARALVFTAPPFLAPAGGAEQVEVVLPFRVDVDVSTPHVGKRSIVGRIRARAGIQTQSPGSENAGLKVSFDASQAESFEIDYDAASQLVPLSPAEATAIENGLALRFQIGLAQLPRIDLPPLTLPASVVGGEDQTLALLRVDASTTTQGGDAALVLGVQMAGNPSTPAQPLSPFGGATGNSFVRVHEGFLSRVFQDIALDPSFAADLEAEAGLEGLQVDDARVRAQPDRLEMVVEGRIVDLCAFGKDLRFTSTTTLTFSVFDGELTITRESALDLKNLDVVFCILLAGLDVFLFGLVFAVVDHLLRFRPFLKGLFDGKGDGAGGGEAGPDQTVVATTFTTEGPIPGTEQRVSAELLQQKIDGVAILALGELSLVPDTASTFVHVRCLRAGTPLAGAQVQLIDQDSPVPAGDDAQVSSLPPALGAFTPTPDQVFATATTDSTGTARFHIAPGDRPSEAGRLRFGPFPIKIGEAAPDLFLRITAPDGASLDSRTVAGGFRLNQGAGHFGTREEPLVLNLPA